jgi:hypothetical protein
VDLDGNGIDDSFVGRNEAFGQGRLGTPAHVASSLNTDSAVFNAQVPGRFTPRSVLQEINQRSANGMSSQDYARVLPGGYQMPSMNGSDESSYQTASMMRMLGRSNEV